MGKKSAGPAPVAPDPTVTAAAQSAANAQTARLQQKLNAVNTTGPTGTTTWNETAPDRWEQTITLSPAEQQSYDLSKQAQNSAFGLANDQIGRAGQALATPFNYDGLPALEGQIADAGRIQRSIADAGQIQRSIGPADFSADRQRAEDAVYQRATSRLDPQYDLLQHQQETALANQGIGINSAAYQSASDQLGRTRNDAYAGARNDAVLAGGQEQDRLFNEALQQGTFANTAQGQQYAQNAQDATFANTAQGQQYAQNAQDATFANTARQQGSQERAYAQNLPIQQLSALMGLGQVSMPQPIQYSPTGVAPTDVLGAYALKSNADQAAYKAKQDAASANLTGLYNLGGSIGSALMFSDVRLKRDIRRVGTRPDGLGVYLFNYIWGGPRQIGVLAQEVIRIKPWAVSRIAGFLAVDYGAL